MKSKSLTLVLVGHGDNQIAQRFKKMITVVGLQRNLRIQALSDCFLDSLSIYKGPGSIRGTIVAVCGQGGDKDVWLIFQIRRACQCQLLVAASQAMFRAAW